jgi:Tol biopolymer transport system component
MSTDRLERRLPEVLTDLSIPAMPDYIDSLLSRTERMSQRPRWSLLERWIPVTAFEATLVPRRLPSLRPVLVIAVLLALIVAAVALYAGSPKLPPPFGLARNGMIVGSNAQGDIVGIDPERGETRTLVAGPGLCCAVFSPDGRFVSYLHGAPDGADPTAMTIANLDGTRVRDIPGDVVRGLDWFEWSPAGDKLLITKQGDAVIVDVASGATATINLEFDVNRAAWIGTSGDVLVTTETANSQASNSTLDVYRLTAGNAATAHRVATLDFAVGMPLVAPDGSKFLYFIWGPEGRLQGDIHVVDLATGTNLAITQEAFDDGYEWENPVWSPDGSHIAVEQYAPSGLNRVTVLPAGGGPAVVTGPLFPTGQNGAAIRFSPDGKSLLVTYRHNGQTWLLPVDGGPGHQVSWSPGEDVDWQRLAP